MEIRDSYLHLFGKEIPFYGLFFVLGFIVAALTALPKTSRLGLPRLEVLCSAVFAAVGGILGAKLLSVLTSVRYIIEYHIPLVDVIRNGFVFYGGLFGGAAGLAIYCKAFKAPLFAYFDLYAAGTALGHAIGRVGCLISGCCYGIPADGGFFVIYRRAADPNTPLGVPLLPVQLIESTSLIVIYLLCEIAFYAGKKRGLSAFVYAAAYSVVRFTLEFFRGDEVRGVYGLSTSQYLSIVLLLTAVALAGGYILRQRKRKGSAQR